jgi:hypothetical protein
MDKAEALRLGHNKFYRFHESPPINCFRMGHQNKPEASIVGMFENGLELDAALDAREQATVYMLAHKHYPQFDAHMFTCKPFDPDDKGTCKKT